MTDTEVRACSTDAMVDGLLTRLEELLLGAQLPPRWARKIWERLQRLEGLARCCADASLERLS